MAARRIVARLSRDVFGHRFRAALRKLIAYALYYSGLLWLYAGCTLHGRAVALMFHRVLPDGADSFSSSGIVVAPETFALQMDFLRMHFAALSAPEFRACVERGAFPRRACLVTFDDGWFDFDRYARPILQRYEIPAVVFVATAYLGTRCTFWQEDFTRRLYDARCSPENAAPLFIELGIAAVFEATDSEAKRIIREAVTRLKAVDSAEQHRIRDRLLMITGKQGGSAEAHGDDTFMEWNSAVELSTSNLITVASHAHSHVPLTRLGRVGASADLLTSRRELARHGIPMPAMCSYPNGDHDADVTAAARDAEFAIGFTTVPGHISPGDDPLRFRRMNIHQSTCASRPEFMCRLLGLF